MTGADNQLITVHIRVRQVSADLGYINIDICPDIGKVSVYGRWSLIREVVEGRFYCSSIENPTSLDSQVIKPDQRFRMFNRVKLSK